MAVSNRFSLVNIFHLIFYRTVLNFQGLYVAIHNVQSSLFFIAKNTSLAIEICFLTITMCTYSILLSLMWSISVLLLYLEDVFLNKPWLISIKLMIVMLECESFGHQFCNQPKSELDDWEGV